MISPTRSSASMRRALPFAIARLPGLPAMRAGSRSTIRSTLCFEPTVTGCRRSSGRERLPDIVCQAEQVGARDAEELVTTEAAYGGDGRLPLLAATRH